MKKPNAVGRPTKYNPDVIHPQIDKYLTSLNDTELPSIEGLADYIDIATSTIFEWNNKHPQFSEYIKKIANKQKLKLMNDGMYGGKEVNASMAIFLLKAIHGFKDGTGTTNIQVNNITPEQLKDEQLDAIIS